MLIILYNLPPFIIKIVAIGRNYAEHVKELNNTAPTEPFFFLKPTSSYLPSGGSVEIPNGIIAHHEGHNFMLHAHRFELHDQPPSLVELGLVIGKTGRDISQADSESHIAGYGAKFCSSHAN
jgi:acylpyruvate hydrolase